MNRKNSSHPAIRQAQSTLKLLIGTACGFVVAPDILAGPHGGVVTAGQGSIATPTGTSTVINQSSNSLSIDWQSFDVRSNESVSFLQPSANSVALNRILDQKPSEIFGRIDSNGRVVLVNSNGFLFGRGSQLNVGALLATSLNVISFDESSGRLSLAAAGSPGAIVNHGTITAAAHGSVSLVGGSVTNDGLIVADYGTVNLAAGRAATLDFYGGGLLRFDADSELTSSGGAATAVDNAGQIRADGGQVLLTASAAQSVFDRAVNNDGLVRANRIDDSGGEIRLVGAGGTVVSSGTLDASGAGSAATGGQVQVLGHNVGLFGTALVDVSGDAGGGVALIGGDFQGKNPDILNADRTIVAPGASILGDARVAGDGGRVIVWADGWTRYYGSLSGRGAGAGGDGGFAEVSGKNSLEFQGSVNLRAANGSIGNLLLDPDNIFITTGGGDVVGGNSVDFNDDYNGGTPGIGSADLSTANVESSLVNASLTLQAHNSIVITDAIDVSGQSAANGHSLTLRAGNDISINAPISTRNGAISITANDVGGNTRNSTTGQVVFDSDDGPGGDGGTDGDGALNAGTAAITISGEGAMVLGQINGGAISVTSASAPGAISQNAGDSLVGTTLTASGTAINLITDIDTLTSGSASAGNLTISNTGALTVAGASATGSLSLSTTGLLTVTAANATVSASLTSTGAGAGLNLGAVTANAVTLNSTGAITDGAGTSVTASSLNVTAADSVDLNTDISTLTASNVTNNLIVHRLGGNLTVASVTAGGAITLTASGALLDGGATVTGSSLTASGVSVTLGTSVATLASATASSGDVVINNTGTMAVTAASGQNVTLTTTGGGAGLSLASVSSPGTVTLNATGAITDSGPGASVSGGTLRINGASSVGLHTSINTLTASGVTNNLTVDELGDVVVGAVTAGGNVALSATGSLLDDDAGTTASNDITGANVSLQAGTAIGSITNLRNGTGLSLDVDTAGTLSASVASNSGQINLNFVQPATLGAGAITLGTTAATGSVLLQANNLNISAASPGAISVGTSNNATVGLRANNTLTLPTNAGTMFVSAPDTLVLRGGTTIVDSDVGPLDHDLTVAANNLVFDSGGGGGSVTLHTTVDQLTAVVGGTAGLSVLETDSISLVDVVANGAVSTTATGSITAGLVRSVNSDVTLTSAGAILDDLDPVTRTRIQGQTVSLTGTSIGSNAGNGEIDTDATDLTLNATNGNISVLEANNANISGFSATGGTLTQIETENGSLTAGVGVDLRPVAGDLSIIARGTGANVNFSGHTLGRLTAGTGNVIVRAGNDLQSGTIFGDDVTLESGFNRTGGTLTLNDVRATNTASLHSDNAIVDDGTTTLTPSVTAGTLSVAGAGSINLDTALDILNASGVTGAITIREQNGITVADASSSGGAVSVTTADGDLIVTNASGTGGVALAANGAARALTLGAVNAGSNTATLSATGAISDAIGSTPSVVANQLSISAAGSVDLDTNVNTIVVGGVTGGLHVREQSGALTVNATATGAVDVSTAGGALVVTAANGNGVTLTAGGAGNAITLGAVNAIGGTVTLQAGGAITDGATSTPSVVANQLTIVNAASADLDTNLTTLDANVAGALNIRELTDLAVTNATSTGGAVDVSTNGALSVANARGTAVTLAAAGGTSDLTLGTVDAGSGNVTLSAGAAITDGAGASVTAGRLNILNAGSVDLDTNVTTLDAINIPGSIRISDLSGDLTVERVNATGATTLISAGAILDDDAGTANTTSISGSSVTLGAATGIGSVTNFGTAAGLSVDVNTSGSLLASVVSNTGAINLNISGAPNIASGGIRLGTGAPAATGSVVLQSGGALDLGALNPGAINIRSGNTASVGYVSGGVLTLNAGGSATDFAAQNLLVRGTDIFQGGTHTIDLTADQLTFVATAPAGAFTLNTNVRTLAADVTNTRALTVNELGGDITLGRIVAQALTVHADSLGGAILDDGDDTTILGGTSVTLTSTGALGGSGAAGALDVNTGVLSATSTGGGVTVNSVGTAQLLATLAAGSGAAVANNGNVSLNAAGDVRIAQIAAIGDSVNVTTTGQVINAAAGTAVNANQLTIAGASLVNLGVDVNTLDAGTVTGAITVADGAGGLTVSNANAGGALTLSTTGGPLTVTTAAGVGATLTSGGNLTLGAVNAGTGTATLSATGAIADAAGATPSIIANQLTITAAASADLDTNVNALAASNVTGALSIREQTGALTVTNASTAGAINVSTVNGALTATTAASTGGLVTLSSTGGALNAGTVSGIGVTLSSNNALTAGTVTAGTAAATLTASGGALNATTVTGTGATLSSSGLLTAGTVNAGAAAATLTASGGALNATNVTGTGATLSSSGLLTAGTVNAGAGVASLTSTGGAVNATNVTGVGASLSSAAALTIGTVNAGAGTATLRAAGAISDGAGATPSVVANQLTVTGAGSVDLDTNVNTLDAGAVTGALTIREQSGGLNVTNAASTGGALTLTAAGGPLAITAASGTSATLTSGGALTLGTINAGTGNATLAATGAITDGAGSTASITANQLTITNAASIDLDTSVATVSATGVTGALSIRDQVGDLTVGNASTSGGALTLSSAGALTVTQGAGTSAALTSVGAMTVGAVNAGAGTASLTATGAINDTGTTTALTAGAVTISGASVGTAANPFNTAIGSLTSTSTTGSSYFRELNNITLTRLQAATNADIVVGAVGDVLVSEVTVAGSNGAGRVLIAAGHDILSTGVGTNITAQDVELRAGGLDTTGGKIGIKDVPLRINAPQFMHGTGSTVPAVVLLQNASPTDQGAAAHPNQVAILGGFKIAEVQVPTAGLTADSFLSTTFSTRTAQGKLVRVTNPDFLVTGALGATVFSNATASGLASALDSATGQGEGALYIDWASFDPNVSLFGTVNPPICLPRDQQEEDDAGGAAGASAGTGCSATTARYDNQYLGVPELRLVLTDRGMEWVRVRLPLRSGGPLRIAQSR